MQRMPEIVRPAVLVIDTGSYEVLHSFDSRSKGIRLPTCHMRV
jgi:hypothetical protein